MQNEVLADRLSNYSDGLVAAMFVFMSGIAAAVGDVELRCQIGGVAAIMLVVVVAGAAAALYALRWLRLWAARLRTHVSISEDAEALQRRLHLVRTGLVWLFAIGAGLLVRAAQADSGCAVLP